MPNRRRSTPEQRAGLRSAGDGPDFLSGGGEMGELMRAHDWSNSTLGAPSTWPQPLRTAARLLLNTGHPMYIFWGEAGACLYNDAYRQSIGPERHPASLGRPAHEVWEEIWEIIGPQIDQVMGGGAATWHENHLVPITRNGRREDVYWTYSYGPIDDPTTPAGVGGILVVCTETTEAVRAQLRQTFWIELDGALRDLADPHAVMATAAELLGRHLRVGRCGYGEVDATGAFFTVEHDWTDGNMPSLVGRLRLEDFGPDLIADYRAGRAARLDDLLADARTEGAAAAYAAAGNLRAGIGVPLVKEGRFVAALFVHQTEPRRWTDDEEALVRGVAERTWAAVERARAETALRASEARQTLLLTLGDRMRTLGNPRAVMVVAAEILGRHLRGDRAGYAEIHPGDNLFEVEDDWTEGDMPSLAGRHRLNDFGAPVIAECRAGRTVRIDDVLVEPLTAGEKVARAYAEASMRAAITLPLVKGGRLAAALYVHSRTPRHWTDEEEALVRNVAERTWEAIERARAEEALRHSERELRFALEAGRFGAWSLDLVTGEMSTSETCRRIFGRNPHVEISHDELREAIHADDRARVIAAMERSIDTGADYDIEYRVVTSSGDIRWVSIRAQPAYGIDGKPDRLAGVSLDVTERKNADARRLALVELSDRFRDLREPGDLSFAAAEVLGRVLGVSRAGYGTIDAAAETITIERDWNAPGIKSLAAVLYFRDYGSYIEDLKRGETVVIADAEKDVRTAATAEALKAISAQAVVNMPVTEEGGFVALLYLNHAKAREWTADELAFVKEVAERTRTSVERRRAEQELREFASSLERQVKERTAALQASEARLRTIFETSYQYQGVMALDGTLLDANATSLSGIEAKLEDVVGKPFWETPWFTGTPGMPEVVRTAVAAVARGETMREEIVVNLPTGWRWFDFAMRPMRDEHGDIVAIVPEAVETTARHRAEEALRQSEKLEAMGQLTGGVAHDFNNLLTPIIGGLDMLHREGVGGEREQRLIGGALQAADRAKTLVQRLLAFARRQPLQPKPVDVANLITAMADLVASTTGPQIKIVVEMDNELPAAKADPNQLEMAILNLAVNARDAMTDGGTLRISAKSESIEPGHRSKLMPASYVRLSVADAGAGMDEATLARAIEPFFSTKGPGKGTGLGLSMVHGLVSQLGGALSLSSKPGLGTNVDLWLPVSDAPVEAADRTVESALGPKPAGTVLLVDDEDSVRTSTTEMLADLGYRVVDAPSAEKALKLLKEGLQADLLVTDHLMPGMNGVDLARAVRNVWPELPVLIVSGFAEADGIAPDLPRLTKPFRQGELAASVRELTAGRAHSARKTEQTSR